MLSPTNALAPPARKKDRIGAFQALCHVAINTLRLPTNTRVSPFEVKKRSSPVAPPLPSPQQDTNSVGGIIRRIARTNTSKSLACSEKSVHIHNANFLKMRRKNIDIYVKAPHYVAGGQVSGTCIIRLPGDTLEGVEKFTLDLIGTESIVDPAHFTVESHTYQFFKSSICVMDRNQLEAAIVADKMVIQVPFSARLPVDQGASYIDKKGSVIFSLQSEISVVCPEDGLKRGIQSHRNIHVYANAYTIQSIADASLYAPICEERSLRRSDLKFTAALPRAIWMAGSPIYLSVDTVNSSPGTVTNLKLELLRRQNTFSQTGLMGSFGLMPVTSTCEVVTSMSLADQEWWYPVTTGETDSVILSVQAPPYHYSVRGQKLIDVTFSLRLQVLVSSSGEEEAVLELPIVLVHPISMDPPPGNYANVPNKNREMCRQLLFNMFDDQSSCSDENSLNDGSIASEPQLMKQKSQSSLSKMRKSLSHWLSFRKSAILAATSAASVRHGYVRAPKQFGRSPDCLGDAGLDIRHRFKTATAREGLQGYSADIYDASSPECQQQQLQKQQPQSYCIQLYSPPPKSVIKAPSEKFEVCVNKPNKSKYPLNKGVKRMLASSRYLISVQRRKKTKNSTRH
ncbi:hypothetical protein VTP01DRAFT_811 [Rhizomucor pusillus]|uniref:uncharacterized protein n=1 Tax=Rhizomucor pusillus TaxID=4840 RepID=UPI0037444E95